MRALKVKEIYPLIYSFINKAHENECKEKRILRIIAWEYDKQEDLFGAPPNRTTTNIIEIDLNASNTFRKDKKFTAGTRNFIENLKGDEFELEFTAYQNAWEEEGE